MTVRVLVIEDEVRAAEAHASYVGRVPRLRGGRRRPLRRRHDAAPRRRPRRRPPGRPAAARHEPARRAWARAAHRRPRRGPPLRRDRRDRRPRHRRGPACRRPGRGALPAEAVHVRDFRSKLEQYAAYREQMASAPREVVQDEVDRLLGSLRPTGTAPLPKGMSAETLRDVTSAVRAARRRPVRERGRGRRRHLPGHRAALPRAPRRHRPDRPPAPVQRWRRSPRSGLPLAVTAASVPAMHDRSALGAADVSDDELAAMVADLLGAPSAEVVSSHADHVDVRHPGDHDRRSLPRRRRGGRRWRAARRTRSS